MNGNWQNAEEHMQLRRDMIRHIVEALMKSLNKNEPPERLLRVPEMAKALELALYRNARSLDEYMDISTLTSRLRLIARRFCRHASLNRGEGSNSDRQWSRYRSNF